MLIKIGQEDKITILGNIQLKHLFQMTKPLEKQPEILSMEIWFKKTLCVTCLKRKSAILALLYLQSTQILKPIARRDNLVPKYELVTDLYLDLPTIANISVSFPLCQEL